MAVGPPPSRQTEFQGTVRTDALPLPNDLRGCLKFRLVPPNPQVGRANPKDLGRSEPLPTHRDKF